MIEVSPAEFEDLVAEALEAVPVELARLVDNVVFVIEDDGPADDPDLLGLYEGLRSPSVTSDTQAHCPIGSRSIAIRPFGSAKPSRGHRGGQHHRRA